jgi:hypothetical protein
MMVTICRALIDGNSAEAVSAADSVTITATAPEVNAFASALRRMRPRPLNPWSG